MAASAWKGPVQLVAGVVGGVALGTALAAATPACDPAGDTPGARTYSPSSRAAALLGLSLVVLFAGAEAVMTGGAALGEAVQVDPALTPD